MKKDEFRKWTTDNVIILDGGTGTNMLAAGMPRGSCTEKWIADHKEVIQKLQMGYIEAGSDIIYAPTFGGNRILLSKYGLEDQVQYLNKTLISYTREVAQGKAYVAGNITTTGRIVGLDPAYSPTMAYENYCEQLDVQLHAGIDLLVVETMISMEETLIALDACRNLSDLPVICTMSVRESGSAYFDGNIIEQANELEAAGADAIGVNCSVTPDLLMDVISGLNATATVPIVAKPNAGLPTRDSSGQLVSDYAIDRFVDQMEVLHQSGATILGGCCGTTPEFIRKMAQRFK